MALIKCSECGKEVSDKATACPNCGAPIEKSAISSFDASQYPVNRKTKKKDSPIANVGLAFVIVAFFVFNFLAVVGVICGLIDIGMNDKKYRHIGGWVAVIMGAIELLFMVLV